MIKVSPNKVKKIKPILNIGKLTEESRKKIFEWLYTDNKTITINGKQIEVAGFDKRTGTLYIDKAIW